MTRVQNLFYKWFKVFYTSNTKVSCYLYSRHIYGYKVKSQFWRYMQWKVNKVLFTFHCMYCLHNTDTLDYCWILSAVSWSREKFWSWGSNLLHLLLRLHSIYDLPENGARMRVYTFEWLTPLIATIMIKQKHKCLVHNLEPAWCAWHSFPIKFTTSILKLFSDSCGKLIIYNSDTWMSKKSSHPCTITREVYWLHTTRRTREFKRN